MAMNGTNIYLRPLARKDAEELLAVRQTNFSFLQPFEPIRPEHYFTLEEQRNQIDYGRKAAENDQAFSFGIFLNETHALIGRIELSGVARGPFQNANLGYFLDQEHNGKGYTTEAVSLCVKFGLEQLGLHRIQAGVMPRNLPSIRVLAKAGFRYEGLAKRYLNINGVWEDHALYAITAEDLANQTDRR
ncbi:GNAT family N-acetyltransferase [Paenibacillus sp. PL91]|uniref:GNAT family N-acetyltransferase n=1 Tax=Paenibacillus sp. PL91 TaxID=2729538 RepID=UPI00145DED88|nr:GNAT family protein [Paenibacillus sp. PL91]MBC9203811.1 GNAT family N-acetyltransferase [Paenibacillus sp. PL91]